MGRWSLFGIILLALVGLAGCGGATRPPGTPLVASIRLSPASGSLDLGATLQFSVSTLGGNGQPITGVPVTFNSSNPAVLTVANNGLACAGTWDSLTLPIVCTPGGVGQAVVTASSSGTTSSPVTVHIHQPISRIVVCPLAPAACTPPPPGSCFSAAQDPSQNPTYQAFAFSGPDDITSTVGPFNWSAVNSQVVTLTPSTVNGVVNGQVVAAPKVPGITQVFASIAGTNSAPFDFTTCAVQSISLAVHSTGGTTITANSGSSTTVDATVTDTLQKTITTAPLTWSSSQPGVTVSSSGVVTSSAAGGASITASCILPTCNIGFTPMQAVYATVPVKATFTSTSTTGASVTAFVSSTGCGTTANCSTAVRPLTGNPPALGGAAALSKTPNSLALNPAGTTVFVGNAANAMQINASATPLSAQNIPNVSGKVLTISPDGKRAVFAAASEVFIVDTSNSGSTPLLISGATAAAFSPDNLKAYILAGTNIYVFSAQAPLHAISLTPQGITAIDAAFHGTGGFAYIGGSASGGGRIMVRNTCDDSISLDPGGATQQIISTPGPPLFLRPLPGDSLVALDPPNLDIVTGTTGGTASLNDVGCPLPFPSGYLGISNTLSSVNLGQGAFNPVGFEVSSDGRKAYVAIENVGTIFVYDFAAGTVSPIALVGNPSPVAMGLTGNGATLLVSGNDNAVHVIDTVSLADTRQVSVTPTDLCSISTGGPPPSCLPDLLVVKH